MIEIGLCCDEGYSLGCGVCITSIFESNTNEKFRIHILTDGLSNETTRRLEETAKKYNQIIEIYKIDISILNGLKVCCHFTLMMYARLLFPKVLDPSITKLLYLDCDIVVVGNIVELWNMEFADLACLAAPALDANDIIRLNRIETYNHPYINSGVLLINITKWKENNYGDKCIEYIHDYPEKCWMPDQDAINAILYNELGMLSFRYNFTVPRIYNNIETFHLHKSMWEDLLDARENPIIIHYIEAIKPWHKEFSHASKSNFNRILRVSLWSDYSHKRKYVGFKHYCQRIINCFQKIINYLQEMI